MNLSPRNIWNYEQNRPTLVVRDLAAYAPADVVYGSLLARGIFKWLAVRRDLIKLKNSWKERLKAAETERVHSAGFRRAYLKGYSKALMECRGEIRALCHSDRWRAPDCDRGAQRYLMAITPMERD